jgi:nucleoside-diphosphate-sugar epimerase
VLTDMAQYGAAKVACEAALHSAATTATIVRSGLIGGYGDWSGRSGYYPWRFAHPTGADVLVPPDLDFPCALIDVEDLAAWLVHAAQHRIDGTFNVTGPTIPLSAVLHAARRAAGSRLPVAPVPAEVLRQAGVEAWMGPRSLPLWIEDPAWRFFATLDTSAARAQGLITRPVEQTLAAALRYEESRQQPRQAGLSDDDERALRRKL